MKLRYLNSALVLAAIVTFAAPAPASAWDPGQDSLKDLTSLNFTNTELSYPFIKAKNPAPAPLVVAPKAPEKPEPPKPIQHVVVDGDNLSKVAEAHGTTWKRLWDKNPALTSPDVLHVAETLTVPFPDEQVPDRPLPAPIVVTPATATTPAAAPVNVVRGPGGPNTYSAGYCTWYVKNRRPDLPSSLGNANTWYSRAAAAGMSVGTTPRAGAVGTTERGDLGHVVYVESVNGNGTITISEMNYAGLYSQRTRTASASEFRYIY